MEPKTKDNRKQPKRILTTLFFLAAVSAAVLLALPYLRYQKALRSLESGELASAQEQLIALDGYADSETALDRCYALQAAEALESGSISSAGEFYTCISNRSVFEAEEVLAAAQTLANEYFERTMYERAHECYSAFGLSDDAMRCTEALYESLTASTANLCGVPFGFESPILDGYKDIEKYRLAYQIELSDWSVSAEENIRLIYDELGDFMNAADHAFSAQRLYGHRFAGETGYYFMLGDNGEWDYNIPGYRLSGYYGLYTKITDGVLYIGSDEKNSWTEQFRFSFSDYDQTLTIYSYRTGGRYTLHKEY